jgi:hypothetical protein
MTSTTKPNVAAGILRRVEQKSVRPIVYGDGVAIALGEHQFYVAVHTSPDHHGQDPEQARLILDRLDQALGAFTYPLCHSGSAVELARDLKHHSETKHGAAPVSVNGVFYDARLLAQVLRQVSGRVEIRAVQWEAYDRGRRPLIIDRAGVSTYVLPLSPLNIDADSTPEAWE